MKSSKTISEQVRRNLVALISLVVAVTSLGYNTWRNEASEHNRNQRLVAIEILRNVGELQQVTFLLHYDTDEADQANPRTGWAIVLTINDLAIVLDEPLPASAERLRATWDEHWRDLGENDAGKDRIIEAIETLRMDIRELLDDLD